MAQLQQPDGLHELRRQRQALRLPDFEPRRERHSHPSELARAVGGATHARTMTYSPGKGKAERKKRARDD
jgi:hypothetical protein